MSGGIFGKYLSILFKTRFAVFPPVTYCREVVAPTASAGRVLYNRVCLFLLPFAPLFVHKFSWDWLIIIIIIIIIFKPSTMLGAHYIVVCGSRIYLEKIPIGQKWLKWPRNMVFGPWHVISFVWNLCKMKVLMVH